MKASEKLFAWRTSHGLTQERAAELAEVSQSGWCAYENGGAYPRVDQALRISRVTAGDPNHVRVEDWERAPKSVRRAKARKALARTG